MTAKEDESQATFCGEPSVRPYFFIKQTCHTINNIKMTLNINLNHKKDIKNITKKLLMTLNVFLKDDLNKKNICVNIVLKNKQTKNISIKDENVNYNIIIKEY